MPDFLPEGNTPLFSDDPQRSLWKINDLLLSGGGAPSLPIPIASGGTGTSSVASGVVTSDGTTFSSVRTSAGLAGKITDEIGTGSLLFGDQPVSTGSSPTFTNVTATGILSITGQTRPAGGIRGETSTGNATTGNIGEYLSSPVPLGSAVAVTTTTQTNIASIVLTAGDWDISFDIIYGLTGATSSYLLSSVSLTSATLDTTVGRYCEDSTIRTGITGNFSQSKSTTRFSLSAGGTVYMIAFPIFILGTVIAYGELRARRSANAK